MIKQLYYKQNQCQQTKIYEDIACSIPWTDIQDNSNNKDRPVQTQKVFIKLKNGDMTPLFAIQNIINNVNSRSMYGWYSLDIIVPYIPQDCLFATLLSTTTLVKQMHLSAISFCQTASDIEDFESSKGELDNDAILQKPDYGRIVIYVDKLTHDILLQANNYASRIKKIRPDINVVLVAAHCFITGIRDIDNKLVYNPYTQLPGTTLSFNKIITTDSTGVVNIRSSALFEVLDTYKMVQNTSDVTFNIN